MSVAELRSIYEGRVAVLEVEKAKKLEAIHRRDSYSIEERATMIAQQLAATAPPTREKLLRDLLSVDLRYDERLINFNHKVNEHYPKYTSIQDLEDMYQQHHYRHTLELEAAHQQYLKYWDHIYGVAKNLTNDLPEVKYAPEFTSKVSAIIDSTAINNELSVLVKLGNLQEVIWKLDEHGFTSEATAMTKLIEDVLMNGEIISKDTKALSAGNTKPLLLEFSSGLKGVFKGDYGQHDDLLLHDVPQLEIAAYKFDQLLGLHVFPITVPRQLDGYSGSVQLFIDGTAGDFYEYYSYLGLIGKDIPPKLDAKNRTFFALTMDNDIDAYVFNNIKPIAGRLIKIDADQAFSPTLYQSAGKDLREYLLENPEHLESLHTAPDFITRLDSITTAQLEEIFQPLFDPQEAVGIVKELHKNIRSYVNAARQLHP